MAAGETGPDTFGGPLPAVDAVGKADAVQGVSGEGEAGDLCGQLFDARHALEVTDVVLRHAAGIAGDDSEVRLAAHAEYVTKFGADMSDEFVVGLSQAAGMHRAADEGSQDHVSFGGACRKLAAE